MALSVNHHNKSAHLLQMFFELMQCAVGERNRMEQVPSEAEWAALFETCKRQAVVGVAFHALERLGQQGQKPPQRILFEWVALSERIRRQNQVVNRNVVGWCEKLKTDGFECCILKGQGNNLLYPDPYSRTPGDIDAWVVPEGATSAEVEAVMGYVKKQNPNSHACYHHTDYGAFCGTEVEVHYRPSFMFNPIDNRRLQRWFVSHRKEQFQNKVALPDGVGIVSIPTPAFNVVFQLSHIYNHLLHEGIGLRQIVDYYYLLKKVDHHARPETAAETLRSLGLDTMAGALMWVLSEVLGLSDQYLIVPKDEKRGKVLLEEIVRGGNFGRYDAENQKADSRFKKNVQRVKRDLRMMRYFPSESLCEPAFRVYHLIWRSIYH